MPSSRKRRIACRSQNQIAPQRRGPDRTDGAGLVEPLRELFKDEVRSRQVLGLPDRIVMRQPFPGPGLAVRIIGEITKKRMNILREADSIVTREIDAAVDLSPRAVAVFRGADAGAQCRRDG